MRETPRLLKIAHHVLGFAPWIVALAVPDFRYGCTAALGLTLVSFALENFLFRTERTMVFPKVLSTIQFALFVVLTILSWADRKNDNVYKNWAGVIINGGMALGCVIATLCGRPFVADFAADKIEDEATASHPLVAHMLVVMNAAWISAFALMAAVAAVGALCNELIRPNLGENFQLAFTDPGYVSWIVLVFCFAFNYAYPAHLKSPKGRVAYARKHDRELAEWAAAHPDHEWAKKYHERTAAEASGLEKV